MKNESLKVAWKIFDADELIRTYSSEWQSLNKRCNQSNPMLDIKFIGPLVKHFSGKDNVLLAVEESSGKVTSMALIQHESIGRWKLFMPSQAVIGPVIMLPRDKKNILLSLKQLCKALPGYAWLLGFQKQDPKYSTITDIEESLQTSTAGVTTTTYIDTVGDFEVYFQARQKQIRQKMKKTYHMLELDNIKARLKEIRDPDGLPEAVGVYGDIESRGWKGKNNTAVSRDNIQGAFYRDVLVNFSEEGGTVVYQLLFDDIIVASLLTVFQNKMQVSLKTTFDEKYAQYSPGRFMKYLMSQTAFENPDIRVIENYTNASPADQKWNSGSRHIYHVNYYRSLLYCKTQTAVGKLIRKQH